MSNPEPVAAVGVLAAKHSILRELREKTAAHHRALEETSGIWPALSSLPSYAGLLRKLFSLYTLVEPPLEFVPELRRWLPDLTQRAKLPALVVDLLALNVGVETDLHRDRGLVEPIAFSDDFAPIRSAPAAFGCLYVLEGSTLGGQMIARQIQKVLGLGPENGCAFFSSYGSNVGQMWKRFGENLETFSAAHPDAGPEIVAMAMNTFELFARTLGARSELR